MQCNNGTLALALSRYKCKAGRPRKPLRAVPPSPSLTVGRRAPRGRSVVAWPGRIGEFPAEPSSRCARPPSKKRARAHVKSASRHAVAPLKGEGASSPPRNNARERNSHTKQCWAAKTRRAAQRQVGVQAVQLERNTLEHTGAYTFALLAQQVSDFSASAWKACKSCR